MCLHISDTTCISRLRMYIRRTVPKSLSKVRLRREVRQARKLHHHYPPFISRSRAGLVSPDSPFLSSSSTCPSAVRSHHPIPLLLVSSNSHAGKLFLDVSIPDSHPLSTLPWLRLTSACTCLRQTYLFPPSDQAYDLPLTSSLGFLRAQALVHVA